MPLRKRCESVNSTEDKNSQNSNRIFLYSMIHAIHKSMLLLNGCGLFSFVHCPCFVFIIVFVRFTCNGWTKRLRTHETNIIGEWEECFFGCRSPRERNQIAGKNQPSKTLGIRFLYLSLLPLLLLLFLLLILSILLVYFNVIFFSFFFRLTNWTLWNELFVFTWLFSSSICVNVCLMMSDRC